jgi:putative transposase
MARARRTVEGEFRQTEIAIPRDRAGMFEPQVIHKDQTCFDGFDEKIIVMYARGLSTRDIQAQLQEPYGFKFSPTLISNVTDSVLDEVKAWQLRPLDRIYPIIYLDGIVVKIHADQQIVNEAIHLTLGINMDGEKESLGMWCNTTEGAKFWLSVLTKLKIAAYKMY